MRLTGEEREKMLRIIARAKTILKTGDRVGCTKCPGTKRVFTFDCWDGNWMVSKSGINDYSPCSIYSINGVAVDFKRADDEQWEVENNE